MTRDLKVQPDPYERLISRWGQLLLLKTENKKKEEEEEGENKFVTVGGGGRVEEVAESEIESMKKLGSRTVGRYPFSQQVELQWSLLPSPSTTIDQPESLTQMVSNLTQFQPQYYTMNLKLLDLLPPLNSTSTTTSLSQAILERKVTGLSIGTRVDQDDVFTITPELGLLLNLTKDTYQTLGLTGIELKLKNRTISRYLVQVDLVKLTQTQSQKLLDRVRWCFTNTHIKPIKFILTITDPVTGEDLPMTTDLKFQTYQTQVQFQTTPQVSIPQYPTDHPAYPSPFLAPTTTTDNGGLEESVHDLLDWSGALSCGLLNHHQSTPFTSQLPTTTLGTTYQLTWSGFLATSHLTKLYSIWSTALLRYHHHQSTLTPPPSILPHSTLILHGCPDAPLTWLPPTTTSTTTPLHHHHHYHLNGDHLLYLFLNPTQPHLPYLTIHATSAHDTL